MVETQEIRDAFAARLNRALDDRPEVRKGRGRNVDMHAALKRAGMDATTQGTNKWLRAESMPEKDKMRQLAAWLGVRVQWLEYGEGEMTDLPPSPLADRSAMTIGEVQGEYAHIRQNTARASAGDGHENPHVEIRGTLAFKKSWLAFKGLKEKNLVVIYADGESMSPTIAHGDVLLVDKSRQEPADGQVFALNSATRGTIVKRLKRDDHGQWALISDNLDKRSYPDQWLADGDGNEMTISGRVVWRGGDM